MQVTTKLNNPAAFPLAERFNEGLSLRDYFAAKAMLGMLSYSYQINDEDLDCGVPEHREGVASAAYMIADAMLKEREKNPA